MSNLSYFLDSVWKDTDGYVYIALKTKEGSFHRVSPKWPEQRDMVIDFINAQTAQQKEVYISPPIWRKKIGNGVKFSRDLFLGSHVLWVDMDGNAPETWPPDPGASTDLSAPPTAIPEPSIRVQTSSASNQHMYWLLDTMVTDVDVLENMTRTLYLELGADSTYDATRVLRPPDTTNYGYGKDERKGKTFPVFLESASEIEYSPAIFPRTKDFRPMVADSLGEIPDIREVLANKEWSEYFWQAFNSGPKLRGENPKYNGRSDQLQELAYLGAESGFTAEEIYAVLLDADSRWKKYSTRTDQHKWLVDIIERAKAKYPVSLSSLSFAGIIGDSMKDVGEIQTLYKYTDFMETKIELDWIIEGLLPVGGYGIIAGPTGIGKTQVGIRLCEKIVAGDAFLMWNNSKKKKYTAMLLSLEMTHPELQQFFNVMERDGLFFHEGKDNFYIVPAGEDLPLDHPDGQKFFESMIAEASPDIIVIDSLSKSMQGDFKDDEAVRKYNSYLNRIRLKYGVAIVIIHHNRKTQDRKNIGFELDDLYGSRFLPQDAAFVLMMGKNKDDVLLMNPAKIRFSINPGVFEIKRSKELDFYMERDYVDADNTDNETGIGLSSLNLFGAGG